MDAFRDIREFDEEPDNHEEPDNNELQDTTRPRQRNLRGRKSRHRTYQRWQQRLQDRVRMAREQPVATVVWHPTAQRQIEHAEAPQEKPIS
jgi:hypothetical protein